MYFALLYYGMHNGIMHFYTLFKMPPQTPRPQHTHTHPHNLSLQVLNILEYLITPASVPRRQCYILVVRYN